MEGEARRCDPTDSFALGKAERRNKPECMRERDKSQHDHERIIRASSERDLPQILLRRPASDDILNRIAGEHCEESCQREIDRRCT